MSRELLNLRFDKIESKDNHIKRKHKVAYSSEVKKHRQAQRDFAQQRIIFKKDAE